ncbi:MAG: SBBP repeat-containing protein [Syntrophobacteraceae bacterium]
MRKPIAKVFLYSVIALFSGAIVFILPEILGVSLAGRSASSPICSSARLNGLRPIEAGASHNKPAWRRYGRLPLYFIENRGQVDRRALFYETGPGRTVFFTRQGLALRLRSAACRVCPKKPQARRAHILPGKTETEVPCALGSLSLGITMAGMSRNVQIIAADPRSGKINCFVGNDPRKWRTGIPTYGAVFYKNAYPGIDVKFYGNNRRLEYDIIVKPGADPSKVKFRYSGARDVRVTKSGDLSIALDGGSLIFKKPGIYQQINGRKVWRQGNFEIREDKSATGVSESLAKTTRAKPGVFTCSFNLGAYDRKVPLVIDPQLVYSTFLGGTAINEAYGIAVDGAGNTYITGNTTSTDFPTLNPVQSSNAGGSTYGDAFVTEIAPGGQSLVYSTYLGGSGDDMAYSIAVDGSGNAYVTGWTDSNNFPCSANPIQSVNKGSANAFVTEIAPGGSSLVFSTYLGGTGIDAGNHIAVDSAGNAYVTGLTTSTDFPLANALYSGLSANTHAFVTEIKAGGQSLVYSTYLGGSKHDEGWGIALDSAGNAYVTGLTTSTDFPLAAPLYSSLPTGTHAFVTEIKAGGQALYYSTYLGGSGDDEAYAIAVDGAGNAFVTGSTDSTNFPTKNPYQATYGGSGSNAFVTEIAAGGGSLVYSTYLRGSQDGWANAIAVDGLGNTYVAGATPATDFPVSNALQSANAGNYDAFATAIAPGGQSLIYSTYLGGSARDEAYGLAVDNWGDAFLTGSTQSTDFRTANPLQPTFAGNDPNAFAAEIGGLWSGAAVLSDGWQYFKWFGYFHTGSYPWIYHPTLGWLYPYGTADSSIWFYDPVMKGGSFWWTSATVYPYVYRVSDGAWLYYEVGTSNPRWFYNYSKQAWEKD